MIFHQDRATQFPIKTMIPPTETPIPSTNTSATPTPMASSSSSTASSPTSSSSDLLHHGKRQTQEERHTQPTDFSRGGSKRHLLESDSTMRSTWSRSKWRILSSAIIKTSPAAKKRRMQDIFGTTHTAVACSNGLAPSEILQEDLASRTSDAVTVAEHQTKSMARDSQGNKTLLGEGIESVAAVAKRNCISSGQ